MAEPAGRQIYLLRPGELSPETIAVTFAKTSRSPLSFREIAADLTQERSAQFHEKYVVGYGHASVAEHAVLHLAFENISRLATEAIESNRLASYTEKSTRYQMWDPGGYHVPVELQGDAREAEYRRTCDQLFSTYAACLDPVREVVRSRVPRKDGETEARWDGRIRSRYVDVCRFLLPASALANVGMTANARTLEHAIRKMLSHPLEEVRAIGAAVKQAALVEVPTLVKYAEKVPYWEEAERRLEEWSAAHIDPSPNPRGAPRRSSRGAPFRGGETERHSAAPFVELLDYDREGEEKVLAAATYRHGTLPAREALERIRGLQAHERAELIGAVLGGLEQHDVPLRVLEHSQYTFDLLMDQGAYLEMKRHRMMTQSPQRLTADLGYSLPRLIREAGQEAEYRRAMEAAEATYRSLAAWNPDVAAYVVPNAFRRRLLISLNLREAYHFCELRSAANAHFSIRRIALRMAELIREVHPGLAAFMRLPAGADWRKIEEENFAEV